jgi:hypothetical protein
MEIQTLRSHTPLDYSLTLPLTWGHEQLTTNLFHRYDSLRPKAIGHPLRRGSGIQAHELSKGDILLIEDIHAEGSYGRQNPDRRLVSLVFNKAVPKYTYLRRKEAHMFDSVDEEPDVCLFATAWAKDKTTATFWHANGFRRVAAKHWFCKAAVDDFYDLSMTLSVDGGKFKALAVYENLRQDLTGFSRHLATSFTRRRG